MSMTLAQSPLLLSKPRPRRAARSSALDFADRVLLDFLTASELRAGLEQVVSALRAVGGVPRIEWWAPTEDGTAMRLATVDGRGRGRRSAVSLGHAGVLVITADRWAPQLVAAIDRLAPAARRRAAEEQLADKAVRLTLENEALEDYASLVAHELKTPLLEALLQEDPSVGVREAIELVDSLLEAARAEAGASPSSIPGAGLRDALVDLGPVDAEVVAELPDRFPFPSGPLRIVLRNLLTNAVRAGARHIEVTTGESAEAVTLCVDDDGNGLDSPAEYESGSGIGLGLIRRLAGRYGGTVELLPRITGGTRAMLVLPGAES